MNINKKQQLQTPGSRRRLVTALGITGWLFKGVLSVFTAAFLIMAAAGLILYRSLTNAGRLPMTSLLRWTVPIFPCCPIQ